MLTVLDLLDCRAKAQGLRAMSSESLNVSLKSLVVTTKMSRPHVRQGKAHHLGVHLVGDTYASGHTAFAFAFMLKVLTWSAWAVPKQQPWSVRTGPCKYQPRSRRLPPCSREGGRLTQESSRAQARSMV